MKVPILILLTNGKCSPNISYNTYSSRKAKAQINTPLIPTLYRHTTLTPLTNGKCSPNILNQENTAQFFNAVNHVLTLNFYQLNVTDAIAFQFMLQFIIKGKDCRLQIKKKIAIFLICFPIKMPVWKVTNWLGFFG